MENIDVLTITPVEHPDGLVRRAGFDLTDPYVEQCWGPVIGPSATVLLRRLPVLWTERVPATITHGELARSLGLGGGTAVNSRLMHSLERTVRFGLATWQDPGQSLDVFLQVPGLQEHQLRRLPEWTLQAHERLVDRHLRDLAAHHETSPPVATMTGRLDRLQRPRNISPTAPNATARALDR